MIATFSLNFLDSLFSSVVGAKGSVFLPFSICLTTFFLMAATFHSVTLPRLGRKARKFVRVSRRLLYTRDREYVVCVYMCAKTNFA